MGEVKSTLTAVSESRKVLFKLTVNISFELSCHTFTSFRKEDVHLVLRQQLSEFVAIRINTNKYHKKIYFDNFDRIIQ